MITMPSDIVGTGEEAVNKTDTGPALTKLTV